MKALKRNGRVLVLRFTATNFGPSFLDPHTTKQIAVLQKRRRGDGSKNIDCHVK